MLEFNPVSLDLIHFIKADLSRTVPRTCDYSLGGILLWRDYFSVRYALTENSLIYRIRLPDGTTAFQALADPDPALLQIIYDHCRRTGEPCRFCFVPAERNSLFYGLFGDNISVAPQRDWYDYLYEKTSFITYSGKKLRGQRNHVNKFRLSCPDWAFVRGTEEHLPQLREFYTRFRQENQKDAPTWL